MSEYTKSSVFSDPAYWLALGAGVLGVGAAAMQERNRGSLSRGSDRYREAFNRAVEMANRLNRDVGIRKDALGGYSVYLFTEAERYSHRGQVVRPGEPKMET